MHLSNLEQVGVEALRRAIRQPEVSAVVIDEIGTMGLILDWLQQDQGEIARRAMGRMPRLTHSHTCGIMYKAAVFWFLRAWQHQAGR